MENVIKYNFMNLNELYQQPLEMDWLIEDVIPSNSIGMVFGASGSGKSHIVFSMAAMIANGVPWFDKETRKGNVLVMAGEGLRGLSSRFKAIEKEHELAIDQSNVFISNRGIGLDTDNGYDLVLQAIKDQGSSPDLIIIDTLSRHLERSVENSNDDMARFINRLEKIRSKHECTIIIVHHTGKGENQSARGASALKGNVDFSFKVTGEDKFCMFSCDKMKDADDNIPAKNFKIKTVDLGVMSSKGKPITGACVVKSDRVVTLQIPSKSKEDIALDCFRPSKKEWQEAYLDSCIDQISEDSKKKQFREARKKLIASGKIKENGDGSYLVIQTA